MAERDKIFQGDAAEPQKKRFCIDFHHLLLRDECKNNLLMTLNDPVTCKMLSVGSPRGHPALNWGPLDLLLYPHVPACQALQI